MRDAALTPLAGRGFRMQTRFARVELFTTANLFARAVKRAELSVRPAGFIYCPQSLSLRIRQSSTRERVPEVSVLLG